MIVSFKDRKSEQIFGGEFVRTLPGNIQTRAKDKMDEISSAISPEDLMIPPSTRLEKLRGDRRNCYSIRINRQWRLCFRFEDGNAYEVEIVDYH